MAISVSFNGSSILKPGSYSIFQVQQPGGLPLISDSTILLVGEASGGIPGNIGGYQTFNSSEFSTFANTFISGPLVDSALAALNPSTTPGVGGFSNIIVWKTNHSTQASLTLNNSSAQPVLTLTDSNWGVNGNYKAISVAQGSSPSQFIITLSDTATNQTQTLPQNAAVAQISIQYIGLGSAASLSITGSSDATKILTTTVTGEVGQNLSIPLSNYNMNTLVSFINSSFAGIYSATLLNTTSGSAIPATNLDPVSSLNILTIQQLFRIQHELADVINQNSSLMVASVIGINPGFPILTVQPLPGQFLSGGLAGASANSDFSTGFNNSLGQLYAVAVPCISQNATADILMGVTDPGSTYQIAAVLEAMSSHLIFRSNVQNRREAQGIGGFRINLKASLFAEAQSLNNYLVQLVGQDIQMLDINGNLTWKQPHVMAAALAGMRTGVAVGTPLTNKYLNIVNLGMYVNPQTGIDGSDFNPLIDFAPAIQAGVTFAESANPGFKIVVDNTTYGIDSNFVFNRGSVIQAAQYIAINTRNQLTSQFVGNKIAAGTAVSIGNAIKALMLELLNSQIITPSIQFPQGFGNVNVSINGNVATVQFAVVPVNGLDFILITMNLENVVQAS